MVSDPSLSLPILSSIPSELYSSDFNLILYCNDIVGSMPSSLKHFTIFAVSQILIRHQVIKNYLFWEYLVWRRVKHAA